VIIHPIRLREVQCWLDDITAQREGAVEELRQVQEQYQEITARVRDLGRIAQTLADVLRVTRDVAPPEPEPTTADDF
jgi:cell division septum initiation protein DivIVA